LLDFSCGLKDLSFKMISLSSKVIFDISSKMSGMALKATPGVMAPYASKASISTSNQMDVRIPNMPKRPLSGFFHFANEIRPMIVKQNPNMKITDVSKILGQKYRELPNDRKMAMKETYKNDIKNIRRNLKNSRTLLKAKKSWRK